MRTCTASGPLDRRGELDAAPVNETRRRLLQGLIAAGFAWREVWLSAAPPEADRRIASLEIVKVSGRRQVSGANQQFQSHPSHVWGPPSEYREPERPSLQDTAVSALYVVLRTRGGQEGLYGPIDGESVPILLQDLGPYLVGRDPLAGDELWDRMYRRNRHGRAGHFMMAISAADNVLWDLRGRLLGLPVFRLLGGARTRVPVYASCLGLSLEPGRVEARVRSLKAEGYRAQKWFFAHGPAEGREGLLKNVDLVRRVRDAGGEDLDIMFDAFMGWDLPYAIAWAKEVERYHPRWIEEPFMPDRLESFAALRQATSVPVATGEHLYGRWEAERYLAASAIHVVQSDPEWCGGASELARIATIAAVHDAQVVPHGHALRAALHVVASQSPATCPMGELLLSKMVFRDHPWYFCHFEAEPLRVAQGAVWLTESPGFGITLDPAKVERKEPVRA